jgi:hypothetical protein
MLELTPEQAAEAARMSPAEWSAHIARYQPPDSTEALRTAASQHLSGLALDSFVRCADVAAFADESGQIDTSKVNRYLTTMYGPQQQAAGAGQGDEWRRRGSHGRAAAAERHNLTAEPETWSSPADNGPGSAGRAAAALRHPTTTGKDD